MLDRDLATMYGVPTGRLNEQVRRNAARFPEDFMFQLSVDELTQWKSHFARTNASITMGLRRVDELEQRSTYHEGQLTVLFDVVHGLMAGPESAEEESHPTPRIGFHVPYT